MVQTHVGDDPLIRRVPATEGADDEGVTDYVVSLLPKVVRKRAYFLAFSDLAD